MCDAGVRDVPEVRKRQALEGLGTVAAVTLTRVADDPDAVEHTPPGSGGRALRRRRDPGSDTHRVQLLGVRSVVSVSGDQDERIAAASAHQRGRIQARRGEALRGGAAAAGPGARQAAQQRGELIDLLGREVLEEQTANAGHV
jgi:hypothetical protein